jgi:hypothetical protein
MIQRMTLCVSRFLSVCWFSPFYVSLVAYLIKGLKENKDVVWDPVFRRLRCNGHIINLSAQAFLFPKLDDEPLSPEEEEKRLEVAINGQLPPQEYTKKEIEQWRQKGPLGKLHNTAVFIEGSNQRLERFLYLSKNLRLLRDNDTRWNSWYKMLERAIRLREPITQFNNMERADMEADTLTDAEWDDLELLMEFLEAYSHATLACEGHYATVERILPIMEFLLDILEKGKDEYAEHPFIGPCTKYGWAKIEKYYKLSDQSPAYIAAVVMCPNRKWKFFEKVGWQPQWIKAAQKKVLDGVWKKYYKPHSTSDLTTDLALRTSEASISTSALPRKKNLFSTWEEKTLDSPILDDEYEQYIKSPVVVLNKEDTDRFNPRAWWMEPTQLRLYPNLSKMALDLLSCPAMSAEVERLFSSCKITICDRRSSLGIDTVEAIECLKSWMRTDNISFIDSDFEVKFEYTSQDSSE